MGRFDLQDLNSAENQKIRLDAEKKIREGKRGMDLTNRLGEDGEKQKEDLKAALKRFQTENREGLDVSRLIEQTDKCLNKWELNELEKKVARIAEGEYQRRLKESGAFDPIHESEELSLARERKDLGKWFNKQKLYDGQESKLDTLLNLKDNLRERLLFRGKLKNECQKSSFVKAEYFRRLNFLPFMDSKQALLNNILEEIKEVQDAPAPVQYEFSKIQKTIKGAKTTEEIKNKILEGFKKRKDTYRKKLLANKQYFGGKEVQLNDGQKVPEALKEFDDYIEERENFADMDDKLKKLPGIIAERKKVYEKRDELLNKLPEESRKRIKGLTDEMRFHTLKAYIPEMEENVENNGVNYLEFVGLMEKAEHKGIPLFTGEEIAEKKNEFKGSSLKAQETELLFLKDCDLDKRRSMVEKYLLVDPTITKDQMEVFEEADGITRKRMVREAELQEEKRKENPLDFSYMEYLDADDIQDISRIIQSEDGQEALEELVDETETTQTYRVLDVLGTTRNRMHGIGMEMQQRDISLVDYHMEDQAKWMRRSKNVFKKDYGHDNARDEWQYQEGQGSLERLKAGVTQWSSGQMGKLTILKDSDLNGEGSTEETIKKVKEARYATDIMITDETGKDELDLLGSLDDKFIKFSKMYLNQMMAKLFVKMGLNPAMIGMVLNSKTLKKSVAKGSVMEEFDNYTISANNEDHYINEMAA